MVISLQPNNKEAYNKLRIAKSKLEGNHGTIAKNTEAIDLISIGEEYYKRGNENSNSGNYQTSIADYTIVINLKPNYADAYYKRGIAKSKLKDYWGAISDFTKVVELKPDNVDAYYSMGIAKLNFKGYSEAIADFTKVINLIPDYAEAYNYRGVAYSYLPRKNYEAREDFEKATKLGYKVDQQDLDRCKIRLRRDIK